VSVQFSYVAVCTSLDIRRRWWPRADGAAGQFSVISRWQWERQLVDVPWSYHTACSLWTH